LTSPGLHEDYLLTDSDAFPSRRALREQRALEASENAVASDTTQVADATPVEADAAQRVPAQSPLVGALPSAASAPRAAAAPVAAAPGAAALPAATRSATRTARGKRRNPITVAFTLIAIPGIFLTTALPAYAFSPNGVGGQTESAAHAYAAAEAQGVTVAANAASIAVARDSFSATSPEELAQRAKETARVAAAERAAKAARASAAEWAVYGVRAEGDDYPWPNQATDTQGGGLSPLGYYYRECVDFVAWRLNRDAGSSSAPFRWTWNNLTPGGGNASSWASAWKSHGWATGNTPVVGAVAWFSYNHVAYVQSVPGDGTVVLEEYNWVGSHAYHKRTVSTGEVPLFLYPPT
jgi:surface antigen